MLDITPGRNLKAVIVCDHCKGVIDTILPDGRTPNLCELEQRTEIVARPYKGWNYNQHLHQRCRKEIERGYDRYITQRDMFQFH